MTTPRILVAAVLVGLGACSFGAVGAQGGPDDAGVPPSDSPTGGSCSVAILINPATPRVGVDAAIRATASVLDVSGTVTYDWLVTYNGVTPPIIDQAADDNSAISIPLTTAGPVHIQLSLPDHADCSSATADVTVLPNLLATASYRLRITPTPASHVPTFEQIVQVHGGTDTVIPVGLSSGVTFGDGKVVDSGAAGVAAYVRMSPVGAPTAIVELYTDASGVIQPLQVLGQDHKALIVPTSSAFAPRVVTWTPGSLTPFTVTAGTSVTGVVHDPSGAALVGANVVLSIDGTPSSVGTTSGTGAFTLHATPVSGATIAITVTPPAASGLPRLVASSPDIALGAPWTIAYAGSLTTRDLAAVQVTRGGSGLPNASASIVGTIAAAGTITDGTTNLTASGDVRITTTTDGTGVLSGRAPAAPLSLIVAKFGEVSLSGLDLTTAAPAQVASVSHVVVTGSVVSPSNVALSHVRVDATGTGALAGVVVQTETDSAGQFSLPLAAGGNYTTRFFDPAGRGAPTTSAISNAATAPLATTVLSKIVHLTGTVTVSAGSPPSNAAVQLLCNDCTGVDPTVPIAETATDANGRFRLAVPDPTPPQ